MSGFQYFACRWDGVKLVAAWFADAVAEIKVVDTPLLAAKRSSAKGKR